jgi:hypothetical protein
MRQRSEERKAFLHGVFTTALEGGIGYWSAATAYRWSKPTGRHGSSVEDLDGFYAVIRSNDEEDGWGVKGIEDNAELRIDADVIARGLSLMRKRHSDGKLGSISGHDYHKQWIAADRTNGDDGDYDADMADQVVQLGLFGEVVFG